MLAGRSLPHAVMMMIPEAYQDRDDLSDELKGFYAFHSCLMEPWDGPAAVAFTNGRVVGATLDRNGLRPGRWVETKDGYVVLGSETGMLSVRPENVKRLGRLQPGKIFLVDLVEGRIVEDEEVKHAISTQKPYSSWFDEHVVQFNDLEPAPAQARVRAAAAPGPARLRLHAGGPARAARPDGARGRGADRLDGQRRRARGPLRSAPAAVQLLQAALRAGHQPADRLHARVDRHVAGHRRRRRGQPARPRRRSTPISS